MDRSSASGSTPAWTEGPGGRLATRGHTVPQPKAVTRESTAATCFTNGRVRARGAPMIVPGVPARPRPVNRSPCIAAVTMRLGATPDDAPRPSRRALPPLPRRDVGALLVLRDARAARAVPGPVDASPTRPHRLRQSRTRLVTRRREPPLWMVHWPRVPAPDRRRVDRRPAAGHAPLDCHPWPPDRARPPPARRVGRWIARTDGPRPFRVRLRAGAHRDRHRTLQALRVGDGGAALRAPRCAARRRVHDLLHGHQPGRVPLGLRLRHARRAP